MADPTPLDKSKFDLLYLFKGDGIKDWWKSWGMGIRLGATIIIIILIALGTLTVWNKLFPKPPSNTVIAQKGSTVTVNQIIQSPKRSWWMPIPYVSVYGEARNDTKSNFQDIKYGYGAQAGVRWDF